ncbi:MAG: hypothetical protein U0Z70_05765 [Thermomicrobiales bacterium]
MTRCTGWRWSVMAACRQELPAADQDLLAARPPGATPRRTGDATILADRIAVSPG